MCISGTKHRVKTASTIFGPRLKIEGSIKSVSFVCSSIPPSVRPFVRPLVTAYLKNRSNNFSDFWYEVRYQKGLNHHRAAFLKKVSVVEGITSHQNCGPNCETNMKMPYLLYRISIADAPFAQSQFFIAFLSAMIFIVQ